MHNLAVNESYSRISTEDDNAFRAMTNMRSHETRTKNIDYFRQLKKHNEITKINKIMFKI